MAKPQIHIIEEQIARRERRTGKVKDSDLKRNTSSLVYDDGLKRDNNIKWRRISFNGNDYGLNYGIYHTPQTDIRTFVSDYISNNIGDSGITATDAISSSEVLRSDGIISENNMTRGEHVIYFTSIRASRPTILPINMISDAPFGLTPVSIQIDLVYDDGTEIITDTVYSSGNIANNRQNIDIRIPQNFDVTIMIYVYSGVEPTTGPYVGTFKIDTAIDKLIGETKSPVPFAPQNLAASDSKISVIDLSWDFDPFAYQGDSIRIQRGERNQETSEIEKWKTIAILNGYTIKHTDSDGIKQGQRYYYRCQYISSNVGESRFSNIDEGFADFGPYSVTMSLVPNERTGLVGYYREKVSLIVSSTYPVEKPMVIHTTPDGKTLTQNDLTSSDGGFTWTGTMYFNDEISINLDGQESFEVIPWKEGRATVQVIAPVSNASGQENDPMSANTGGGTVAASKTYIIDRTPPVMSNIYISNDDDRIEDNIINSTAVFIFTDNIVDNDSNAFTQDNNQKFVSGVYQIQFSNDGVESSQFGPWQNYEDNISFPWRLTKVASNTQSAFRIVYARVRDRAGNISTAEWDSASLVNYYPYQPDFTITGYEHEDRVTLHWEMPNGTGLQGYLIYKSEDAVDPRNASYFYDTVENITVSSYTDSNVSTTGSYNYVMKVYDKFGIPSTNYSNIIWSLTPTGYDFTPVGGPNSDPIANPSITGASNHWQYIDLFWEPNTEFNFKYYTLYRSTDSESFDNYDFVVTGLKQPSYRDTGVAIGSVYYYWLSATNEAGDEYTTGSADVYEASGYRLTTAPTPPIENLAYQIVNFGHNIVGCSEASAGLFKSEEVDFVSIYKAQVQPTSTGTVYESGYSLLTQQKVDPLNGIGVYQDNKVVPGESYEYAFTATNYYGYESDTGATFIIGPSKAKYDELFFNLIDNGDFSRLNVDNTFTNWNTSLTGDATSSGTYVFGQRCFPHPGGTSVIYQDVFCKPNKHYYFSVYLRRNEPLPTGAFFIDFYEPGGTSSISTETFTVPWDGMSASKFTRTGFDFTAPATATFMRLTISGSNASLTDDYYLDGVQIEEYTADSPRPFIASRTISADRIAAHFIQGDMIEFDTLTGQHLQAETISGREITASSINAYHVEANSLGANELSIGVGTNLVFNGAFLGWEDANSDDPPGWNNNSKRFKNHSSNFYWGGQSAIASGSFDHRISTKAYEHLIEIDNTKDHVISFFSASGTYSAQPYPSGGIRAYQYDDQWGDIGYVTITPTGGYDIQNIDFSDQAGEFYGWDRFWGVISSSYFNPSTKFLRIDIMCSGVGAGTQQLFDGVQLEAAREPTPYKQGGITKIIGGMIETDAILTRHLTAESVTVDELAADSVNASKIQANSITADELAVGFGGNMLIDGGFERWSSGVPDTWTESAASLNLEQVGGSDPWIGDYCARTSGSDGPQLRTTGFYMKIPFDSSGNPEPINVSFYIKRPSLAVGTAQSMTVDLMTYSGSTPILMNSTYWPRVANADPWTTTGDNWQRLSWNFNDWDSNSAITNGAKWFGLAIYSNRNSPASWTYIDGAQITRNSGAQDWKPNAGTIIVGDWIKTGKIQSTNYIEGTTGWRINLDGSVEFNDGTFRGQLDIGSLASENILIDGSLERFATTGDTAGYWPNGHSRTIDRYSGSTSMKFYRASGTGALFGDHSVKASGGSGANVYLQTKDIYRIARDEAGNQQEANFSAYFRHPSGGLYPAVPTGGVHMGILVYEADPNGNPDLITKVLRAEPSVPYYATSGNWHRRSATIGAGTVLAASSLTWGGDQYEFFSPVVSLWHSGAGTSNTTNTYLDGIQVTWGNKIKPFSQNVGTRISGEWIEAGAIQSVNYIPETQGFSIDLEGDAEFSDVTIRGTANIYGDALISGTVKWGSMAAYGDNLCQNGSFESFNATGISTGIYNPSGAGISIGSETRSIAHWTQNGSFDAVIDRWDGPVGNIPEGDYCYGMRKSTSISHTRGTYQYIPLTTGTGKQSITISHWLWRDTNADPVMLVRFEDSAGLAIRSDTTIYENTLGTAGTWCKVAASFAITGSAFSSANGIWAKVVFNNTDLTDYAYFDGVMVEYSDAPDWTEDSTQATHLSYASRYSENVGRFIPGESIRTGRIESNDQQTYFDLDDAEIRLTHSAGVWTEMTPTNIVKTLNSGSDYYDYMAVKRVVADLGNPPAYNLTGLSNQGVSILETVAGGFLTTFNPSGYYIVCANLMNQKTSNMYDKWPIQVMVDPFDGSPQGVSGYFYLRQSAAGGGGTALEVVGTVHSNTINATGQTWVEILVGNTNWTSPET